MIRRVFAIVLLGTVVCAAAGEDKDPIKEKLFAAKVAYDKEMRQFRKQIEEWLDKQEEAARKAGDKKAVEQIKDERKSFDETGDVPTTAPTTLRQIPDRARKALETAYEEAVKAYIKAKKDDEAAAVEAAWKEFKEGSPVDLLALVDVKTHAVTGTWKRNGKALVGTSRGQQARLQFPYEPGEEYDLELSVTRTTGKDAFCVGLVAGERRVLAVIDGRPALGYRSGLDQVDGKEMGDNVTTVKGPVLRPNKENMIVCSVRSGKVEVAVNGKVATAFKGEFTRLSLFSDTFGGPNKKALFLHISSDCGFKIDHIVVRPVKGKGTVLK